MGDIIDKNDLDVIKRVMLGGAALGGGTALVTSLMNYLSKLNEKNTERDDDTLYVKRVPSPALSKEASLGGGIALAGGALSAAGTYALIKKIYNTILKNEAQKELDEAQRVYLETQGFTPTEKKAGFRGLNLGEILTSLPVAVPLLVALGGGVGAYKLLDKQFPSKVKKPRAPKRIEVIDDPETEEEDIYENEKMASCMESDCMELLTHLMSTTPGAVSDVNNLVHAVADGGLTEFKKAAAMVGFVPALGLVKGASAHAVDPMYKQLAITYLTKSAQLSNQYGVILASEFAEKYPTFFKQAAALPEEIQEPLYKIACLLGNAIRAERAQELGIVMPEGEETLTKTAFMDILAGDAAGVALEKLLTGKGKEKGKEDLLPNANDADSSESTDTSGEEVGISKDSDNPSRQSEASKIKYVSSAKSSRGFLDKLEPDEIDEVLQANR